MIKKSLRFEDHLLRYHNIYMNCEIRTEYEQKARLIAAKIISNKDIYKLVSDKTNVPWPLIGAIHNKEASMNFSKCLHNGQPWNKMTTIVPKGRGPFKSWDEAAIDALSLKKKVIDTLQVRDGKWTFEQCLWFAEGYNGWGYYLYRNINSPYVWCGTTAYQRGGYPKDGVYDPNHVVKNTGVAAVLIMLYRLDMLDLTVDNDSIHLTDVRFIDDEEANA